MQKLFAFLAMISELLFKGKVSILAPPGEQIATSTVVIPTSMAVMRTPIEIDKQHRPHRGPKLGFLASLQMAQAFVSTIVGHFSGMTRHKATGFLA